MTQCFTYLHLFRLILNNKLNSLNMRYVFTVIAAMFFIVQAAAQTASVTGFITHTDSLTPIANASVFLQGTRHGTITNGKGNFRMAQIPPGTYQLQVSFLGYKPLSRKIKLAAGDTLRLNLALIETTQNLNTVNVTSSITGGNSGIKDIPGSAYYISPKEIEKFSYTDINRTLRAVPGINIQEEDGFGLRPNIGLRGTGVERSSKITVMEDGVLMAPAPYAAPAAYYFPTIGRMQAIEILKGSSQIKYGPYTTGGAINLISTPIPEQFSGRMHLLGGSYGGRNLHAYVGNAHKNVAYLVETFQYKSNGFKVLDRGGNTGFDKKDYLAKLKINTNPDAKIYQSLTFKVGQTQETSNETYLGLTQRDFQENPYRRYAGSQEDVITTEQTQISLTHFAKFSKNLEVTTTAYRSDFHRNWYKLDKVKDSTGTKYGIAELLKDPSLSPDAFNIITGASSANGDALDVKANNRTYYAQGVQSVLSFLFNTKAISHKVDFGIRLHQDQVDRFQWVDEYAMDGGVMELTTAGVKGTESNRIETANAFASYIQYRVNYGKLTLTPGLRYENIFIERQDYGKSDPDRTGTDLEQRSNQTDVFIPGMGVDYKFTKHLSAFGGVHKGFSPPGSKEGTQPEKSINYELGVRYRKNAFSAQAVAFYSDYDNLLGTDLTAAGGAGTNQLFNGGAVVTQGLELQAGYDLLASHSASFSLPVSVVYTLTDATFLSSFESDFEGWGNVQKGDELPYFAKNQLVIMLGLEHRRFNINLSGKYLDEMRTEPGQGDLLPDAKTDAYFVLDASVSYRAHRNISLFANVTNISDQMYIVARRPAGVRPGMPRAFMVGLKADF